MHLILGTAQLMTRYGVMATDGASEPGPVAVLDAARRLGIRAVDTAPTYGEAETMIGHAGADFAVHTKLPRNRDASAALAGSLRRLRREWVEVVHLHDADIVLDVDDPRLAAAAGLVGRGAEALGASVYTRQQFIAAVEDSRVNVVQAPLNVLDRSITDEDLILAARTGTDVLARSALLQGLLGDPERALGRVPPLDAALKAFLAVCGRVGRPPIELAISWVRSRPCISGVVLGAESPEQLEGLARAFSAPPVPDEATELLASLPVPPGSAVDPRTWNRS